VIELLQCQQWLARKNFYAHCLELQDASDRDALLEDKNKLDFTPFWKPVVEDPRKEVLVVLLKSSSILLRGPLPALMFVTLTISGLPRHWTRTSLGM
jgi:hypothetical protein